jgi:putative oxidoreductase
MTLEIDMYPSISDDVGKLILRLTLGILVLFHGFSKITHGVGHIEGMVTNAGLPSYVAYGVYIGEVLGPLLVLFGFYARFGAALIVIDLLFAFGLVHRHDLLSLGPQGGWALELQGFYLFTALALVFIGPGRVSFNRR